MSAPIQYDVAILDSGLSSSILGSILARHGLRVILIDKATHPRFTIGESTVPETSLQLEILAARYGVPELANLASFHSIRRVMRTHGIKTNFGFVYHRKGQSARLSDMHQTGPLSEIHLYRQDVDAYLFRVAIGYGCHVRQPAVLSDIEFAADRVTLKLGQEEITCRYLVDGMGKSSLLGTKFGLRDATPRARTHSRAVFTHMIGVKPYDEYVRTLGKKADLPDCQFHQGTLHHIIPGGWMWVIPMDNNAWSNNPVCSVGINLDPRIHPDPGSSPAAQFADYIRGYPDLEAQFADAHAVQPWVKTGRLQYTSKQLVGDRFCMLSHGCGFIDALYSRGLCNTTKTINFLAAKILEASKDDDFSAARFADLERYHEALIRQNDQLVHGAYTSFRSFELWNAWIRIWMIYVGANFGGVANRFMDYLEQPDDQALWRAGKSPELGWEDTRPAALLERADDIMMEVEANRLSEAEAIEALFTAVGQVDFALPLFPFDDRSARFQRSGRATFERLRRYLKQDATMEFRELYFSRSLLDQLGHLGKLRGHDLRSRIRAKVSEKLALTPFG